MRYLAAVVLLSVASQSPAAVPFSQGPKLVGTLANGTARQGYSVALSADGNTAVLGGPYDNGGKGAVWVFRKTAGFWQQEAKLVASGAVGNAEQGWSVAVSADGNTVLSGGYADNAGAGAAWALVRVDGVWYGQKLLGTGAAGKASQGWSVAVSSDGSTALVGGRQDDSGVGAAWVYTRSGNSFSQQGGKLTAEDIAGYAQQGHSVALSADGDTAIVGALADSAYQGSAVVYTRAAGIWTQQGAKLRGDAGGGQQGSGVDISADGNTAIVGGWQDSGTGAAWVFTRSHVGWTQQGAKLVGTGVDGNRAQGYAVAISDDGSTALVGGWGDFSDMGEAWVFTRSGGVWSQLGGTLARQGGAGAVYQGIAVAISGDASTALVGGWGDNADVGAAWVFTRACARGEVNGDGVLDVTDVFYLINYLFAGGPAPGCY